MKIVLDAFRALLPRACPGCGSQLGRQSGLCAECRAALQGRVQSHSPLSPQPVPHLITLGTYQGVLRRSVRALKYGGARDLAPVLGAAIAQAVPVEWQVRAVIPVPLHPHRERKRGFNQAELLAQGIAIGLNCPTLNALSRVQDTAQQARRHAAERQNLHGAFRVTRPLPPGTLLLVDDVLTTGQTLAACRDALIASGVPAERLKYAVIAR